MKLLSQSRKELRQLLTSLPVAGMPATGSFMVLGVGRGHGGAEVGKKQG